VHSNNFSRYSVSVSSLMGDCARKSQALFIEVKQPSSTSSSVRKCEDAPSVEIFLAPFSPIPSLDFGDVRLGQSRVGSLSCVNPGPKSLSVLIDKFPKEEKGFSLDFSSGAFHLKPQEAANLSIGWVPRAIGGMRETVSIKYGSLKTSLTLSGLCSDPSAEKSRKAFRRPVLKSIQTHSSSSSSSSSSSASKIFLPPNPVTSQPPGRSPPKRSIPLQARITPRKTQREVISWSPQPVHFMDGSFLRKGVGEESKLLETTTEKIPLPSWTGSASSLRKKTENSWTPVDEEFMRKHSVLHVAGNESLIPDESLSSESSKASLPRESLFILNEIESVKAKLQESGIKQSPVLIKKSSDVLSDIQTNLVCSPARSSEIIEQLQLSDINVCLDLSPQEEKPVSQKLKSPLGDLSFKLDLSLSPKKETAPKEFDLSINVNLDLSPPQASPQNETEVPKENSNIVKLSKQPEMDEISMMVAEHLSMEANPKEEMQQLKQGSNGKMDEISFLVAEHLNEKRPYHRLEDSKKCDFLREETIYETNLLECKESFLQTTINETSFVPIPEKGYCSTAVKDKSKELSSIMDALSEDRSSAFCRDLFGSKGSNDSQLEAPSTPPKTYKKRVSSDTYILSPEIKKPESKAIGESFTIALSPPKLSESVFKVPSKGLESSRIVKKDGKPKSVRPRISSSIPISTFSASKASPHKRGSPFKRRSLAPRSSSKSGQTLIKMAAASNPKIARVRHASSSSIARHPNLFAAKNLYYDERWIEKQRKGFTKWLNFLLTPEDGESKKTDGAKLWNAWSKGGLAPSKEDMSFRAYTLGKEMNSLRMSAMRLWQSPAIVKVIRQLEIEIEKKRLYVRDDRCLNKDLGIKQSFLSLLLNYNPLWLRIGLETLYGEVLQVSGNSDILGISRFIITRLLSNPSILEAYSHPTVPHLYKPGHEEALKKFTLKMFLRLIFFLDVAKNQKLIKHDPCLFCKDSDFK
ncbi:Abnormal spindlelike microcephalyassociated protein -like protein, partial [Caligus rogercresseyi]